MKHSTNQLKSGQIIEYKNSLFSIEEIDFFKPGKGPCYFSIKMKDILSGDIFQKNWKPAEMFQIAETSSVGASFSYIDGNNFVFINTESFEQYLVNQDLLQHALPWLEEGMVCVLILYNGQVIQLNLPTFVHLTVIEADNPANKHDTSSPANKRVYFSTKSSLLVPSFINVGDVLKIDTRAGIYTGRVSKGK